MFATRKIVTYAVKESVRMRVYHYMYVQVHTIDDDQFTLSLPTLPFGRSFVGFNSKTTNFHALHVYTNVIMHFFGVRI